MINDIIENTILMEDRDIFNNLDMALNETMVQSILDAIFQLPKAKKRHFNSKLSSK